MHALQWRRRAPLAALVPITAMLVSGAITGAPAATADEAVDCSAYPWMDTSRTADQRAQALLDASTLDQKLRWLDEIAANNPQQTQIPVRDPENVRQTTLVTMPAQVPCTPVIQYADGPEYVNAGPGVTYFPAPIANAAAWSAQLSQTKGAAQADEAWNKQRNVLLAPGIASGRDPRSGRTSEYLGEDALLSGILAGAASIRINGNPDQPVAASVKHLVANEQETDRQTSSSNLDERTLRETYTLPFEIAIKRGDIDSVMCSYNQINGTQACSSDLVLRKILRDEIGFQGFVMTDFFAKHSLTGAVPDIKAGLDQELNAWLYWSPAQLKAALANGSISEADIDASAFRVVRSHVSAGLFDVARPMVAKDVVSTPAHKAVAREVAEKGAVLLKNQGVLPLQGKGRKIAVIGTTAANTVATNDVDASSVCTYGTGNGACTAVAPLESITARAAAAGDSVVYADGSDLTAAAATAKSADTVVVFGYYKEGEFSDRPNLSLDGNGDALVEAVAAANKNTVVVLQTGGPVLMPWLSKVKGVLETWYAGEQMGPAVAGLLYGDVNPSGKLPMTFPKSEADLPTAGSAEQFPGVVDAAGIRQVDYTEGLKTGYKWYAAKGVEPLFPFGYGLSYSGFAYSNLHVTPNSISGDRDVRVRFRLKNTGTRTATETAQVYVELPASTGEPAKRLVGWQQVTLEPGESRNVRVELSAEDIADLHLLQYFSTAAGKWKTASGTYGVTVGGSFQTTLADTFQIR